MQSYRPQYVLGALLIGAGLAMQTLYMWAGEVFPTYYNSREPETDIFSSAMHYATWLFFTLMIVLVFLGVAVIVITFWHHMSSRRQQ